MCGSGSAWLYLVCMYGKGKHGFCAGVGTRVDLHGFEYNMNVKRHAILDNAF